MKKIYFILSCMLLLHSANTNAQCQPGRFLTEIFPTVTKDDSVVYSTPYGLGMDVYQPADDTMAHRPLIILAHGGSFVGGNKEDDTTIVQLCNNFAKRGYVTASINYRLGNIISMYLDSTVAIDVVIKAISDGKAAVRYFMKDAATTNTYKIDTNNIFVGGNSAGAVLYMHAGYIDSLAECPSYIVTAMAANGGFEGNSGNPGYTTKMKAVVNLAGALNATSFVGPGNIPSVNAQGTNDNTVPYNCALALGGSVHVNLCGLGVLEAVYDAQGIYHMSHIFPGDGHVPWSSDAVKMFTVDSMVTQFLYNLVCTNVLSVNTVNTNAEVSLFPNPASEYVTVAASQAVNEITVYDATGRTVFNAANLNRNNYEINTSRFNKGIYLVKMKFNDANNTPVVKRIVVE